MSNFELELLRKIDSGEELTEREISELVCEHEIERNEGDEGRWERFMESIVEIGDRTFSIEWSRGLTECQENSYLYQPEEVEKKEYEKLVKITEWVPIKKQGVE